MDGFHKFSLESATQRPDIEEYIHNHLEQRQLDKRLLVKDIRLVDDIHEALSKGCQGMYAVALLSCACLQVKHAKQCNNL